LLLSWWRGGFVDVKKGSRPDGFCWYAMKIHPGKEREEKRRGGKVKNRDGTACISPAGGKGFWGKGGVAVMRNRGRPSQKKKEKLGLGGGG